MVLLANIQVRSSPDTRLPCYTLHASGLRPVLIESPLLLRLDAFSPSQIGSWSDDVMQLALEAAKSALSPLRGTYELERSFLLRMNSDEHFFATCVEPMTRSLSVEYPARKCASVRVIIISLTDLHPQAGPLFTSALCWRRAQGPDTACLRGRLPGLG